jgi:hypothetical protein
MELKRQMDVEKSTVAAINAYCRVLELQLRSIAEGANPFPPQSTELGRVVSIAAEGLSRELQLLTFLRTETDKPDCQPASRGGL